MSIRLQVQAKRPGLDMMLNTVDMVFDYQGTYTTQAPEAYETLLLDTMLGDQTLFMRGDQVEAAWDLIMPILHSWQNRASQSFPNYSADSWGPELAEALIVRVGLPLVYAPTQRKEIARFYTFTPPPTRCCTTWRSTSLNWPAKPLRHGAGLP